MPKIGSVGHSDVLDNKKELFFSQWKDIQQNPTTTKLHNFIQDGSQLLREYRYCLKKLGYKKKPKQEEFKIRDLLYKNLCEVYSSVKVSKEKRTKYGIIDIFIERQMASPIIIEIKKDIHGIPDAVSQLFRYAMAYPKGELYIHCPEKLPKKYKNSLAKLNIRIWN